LAIYEYVVLTRFVPAPFAGANDVTNDKSVGPIAGIVFVNICKDGITLGRFNPASAAASLFGFASGTPKTNFLYRISNRISLVVDIITNYNIYFYFGFETNSVLNIRFYYLLINNIKTSKFLSS
jgi:hypothetical protein